MRQILFLQPSRCFVSQFLTIAELHQRMKLRSRLQEADIRPLLAGPPAEKTIALQALAMSELCQSVEHLAELAHAESYTNSETMNLLQELSSLAEHPLPYLNTLRNSGIAAIEQGRLAEGLATLESATKQGWLISSNKSDAYHRQLMSYMHDPLIDAALTRISEHYLPPRFTHGHGTRRHIVLLASTLLCESSATNVTVAIAHDLSARGYQITIVTSEYWCNSLESICDTLAQKDIHIERAPHITELEKIQSILTILERLQPDLVLYMITPMDFVAKIISAVGAAPAQCMINMAYEHHCGKLDFIFQTTCLEQERITAWPGKSKYVGSFASMEQALREVVPLERKTFGIPEDAVVLVTHGRVSKCSQEYISAIGRILAEHPQAVLALAGTYSDADTARFDRTLAHIPLGKRIYLLGPLFDNVPAFLKACDIYLDPFPWPGGQSTLEAMWSGLPVVSMQGVERSVSNPDSYGPIASATEAFLPSQYRRASPGNIEEYSQIAAHYITDGDARSSAGIELRSHVARHYGFNDFMNRLEVGLVGAFKTHAQALA
jgi:hypothetical protein